MNPTKILANFEEVVETVVEKNYANLSANQFKCLRFTRLSLTLSLLLGFLITSTNEKEVLACVDFIGILVAIGKVRMEDCRS